MKQSIQKFFRMVLLFFHSLKYDRHYRKVEKMNGIINRSVDGEKEWRKKWSKLGVMTSNLQYRVFSRYIGPNINIVPENICHDYIEAVLNPVRFVGYYSDKNIFDKLFPKGYFPKTILRKMGGLYYTDEYDLIPNLTDESLLLLLSGCGTGKVVVKPSVDGMSGKGVQMFERKGNGWYDVDGHVCLSVDYLNKIGREIIIQEAVLQCDYISQFNPSSVNTLRISLYRSVKDDTCHVTGAILRIGGKGSVVDNAHAGGCFVGIHEDGTFCHEVVDQFGRKRTKFNDIDFSSDFKYPNWNNVLDFAKSVGKYVTHHRLLALDIVLDQKEKPRLIEFNCMGYSTWLFQYTVGSAFGKFTDEILDWCKMSKENVEYMVHM